ncbi:hypothetical protein [Pseudonocardia nigra]|uniref:hypothetical protein n=1 Tax=Pseudonocardia nigra TaxID=1921578 RepID=UPI001C5FF137|nr:hypothetical protein [Pseudonocardia nigra]
MHAQEHDTTPVRHEYLRRIAAEIDELDRQNAEARAMPHRTDAEHAARAARLALICARTSAWWGVLARKTYRDHDMHVLHGRSAVIAEHTEKDRARFWRDAAADWQARTERRPTSDAAGALSNWHELGVTA